MAFSAEQKRNAAIIARVGRTLGASQRDILISLMTALQESGLRNLNYGDRDSIGLFQQRNAWASRADRLDPAKAARMFFLGGGQGQRGLLDFKQRTQWSLTQAAQKVQVSAFPNAYAKWEDEANGLLGGTGGGATVPETGVTPPPIDLDQFAQGQLPEPTETPQIDTKGMPLGVSAPSMAGIESGDKMPVFEFGAGGVGSAGGGAAGGDPDDFTLDELDPDRFKQQFPQGVPASGSRDLVIKAAKSALGKPYVWGGNDLSKGVDCSGLLQQAFKTVGINLPRISNQQARFGKRVGLNQLKPGDLVALDNSSRNNGADHIAIWLGNGQIIEAPRSGLSVRIRNIDKDEGWWGVAIDY